MPVLLLAHGDPAAKDRLRQAIEARYGMRPPAIDSLRIDFKGRAHTKIGPLPTWVPVEATAFFRFPTAMRWDFQVKPLNLTVQRGIEAFDGETYRTTRGDKTPDIITDPELIQSMRRRLWAVASILLTPLSDQFVKLSAEGDSGFTATNTKLDDSVNVFLRADKKLDYVQVDALNPETNQHQNHILRLAEELTTVNDLILPQKVSAFWDDKPSFEVEPTAAEINPTIPDAVFTIEE